MANHDPACRCWDCWGNLGKIPVVSSPAPPPAEAPCAGCAALREQVDEFRAALTRSEDRFQAALRALESLTPGGSEFVGDIEACVAHVRHRYRSQHETVLAFGRRAQAAEARVQELEAALGRHKRD